MTRLLALLLVLATACAGPAKPTSTPTTATDGLAGYALQPINSTGEMSASMYYGEGRTIDLGLAVRDNKHAKVVRLTERLPDGGWRFVELFTIPTTIATVPTTVRGFDFAIDTTPRSASEVAVPGEFRVTAYANEATTGYTTTWELRLDNADKLTVQPPVTRTHDTSKCETCD